MVAGFLFSAIIPVLHADWPAGGTPATTAALKRSGIGMIVGGGVVYAILRLGKLLFGRHKFRFEDVTRVVFTETSLHMPGQQVPYEEIFYRRSDTIVFEAQTAELIDRCYRNAQVRISPVKARIAEDEFNPEDLVHLEATTREITVPREAMGLGDVKFMAAIGSFLGWQGALFSLMVSAIIGSMAGVALILLKKREWASRLPYGPYIAMAATVWIFGGRQLAAWWFRN
jgi:leader peptidase (prepilin peptidase)/N-methyltransferase